MIATNIQQKVAQFKQQIFQKLHHRTLLEYTGQPIVSDDELLYLLLPFLNGEAVNEKQLLAAEGVAMNMAALNAHDFIEEHGATSKSQQLLVLAGDLYSGMYYATLAEVEDVALIRAITEAVAIISEEKAKLYEDAVPSFDEVKQSLMRIESESICKFFIHYHLTEYIPFVQNGLVLKRLVEELKASMNNEKTVLIRSFHMSNEHVEALLRDEIEKLATTYKNVVSTSPLLNDDVKKWIVSRIQELLTD